MGFQAELLFKVVIDSLKRKLGVVAKLFVH